MSTLLGSEHSSTNAERRIEDGSLIRLRTLSAKGEPARRQYRLHAPEPIPQPHHRIEHQKQRWPLVFAKVDALLFPTSFASAATSIALKRVSGTADTATG